MRKLLLALALTAFAVVPVVGTTPGAPAARVGVASAHGGSITNNAAKPCRTCAPSGFIKFSGTASTTEAHVFWIKIEAGRRNGSSTGSFTWFSSKATMYPGTTPCSSGSETCVTEFLNTVWDCHKDYRTRVSSKAWNTIDTSGPPNHTNTGTVSSIFSSTC